MNHDDALWNIMGQNFCSFKVKTHDEKVRFCRNPYNLTGLCQKGVCPLANAQYATVVEHEDELFLYVKVAERAHLPRRQWEKIRLDKSFPAALAQIDDALQWWDQKLVIKVKARLLRLKQYLMRRRKIMMEPKVEYVSVNKRQEDKLLRREEKAEAAARIEVEIEKELLERLRAGTYEGVINYDKEAFEKLLDEEEDRGELDELEAMEDEDMPEFVIDDEESDEEMEEETVGKKSKRGKLLLEEEIEREPAKNRMRYDEVDW